MSVPKWRRSGSKLDASEIAYYLYYYLYYKEMRQQYMLWRCCINKTTFKKGGTDNGRGLCNSYH